MATPTTNARYQQILRDITASLQDLPESAFQNDPMYNPGQSGQANQSGSIGQAGSTVQAAAQNAAHRPPPTQPRRAIGAGVPATDPAMANLTGWAATQNFNPTELEHIYQNPQAILPYIFGQMAPGSAGYNRLRNLQWDPLAIMMMSQGAGSMMADPSTGGGVGGFANFLNDLYSQIGTAGGQGVNAAALLRNIFAQEGTSTGDAKTSLGQMLGAGDSTQQSRTLYNLVRDLTQAGMNPLAAQGMQAAMMNQLDRYNSSVLTQDSESVPSAVDWVRQNAPWLAMG